MFVKDMQAWEKNDLKNKLIVSVHEDENLGTKSREKYEILSYEVLLSANWFYIFPDPLHQRSKNLQTVVVSTVLYVKSFYWLVWSCFITHTHTLHLTSVQSSLFLIIPTRLQWNCISIILECCEMLELLWRRRGVLRSANDALNFRLILRYTYRRDEEPKCMVAWRKVE